MERAKIGHREGCVTINCSGCGSDFYSTDYSGPGLDLTSIPPLTEAEAEQHSAAAWQRRLEARFNDAEKAELLGILTQELPADLAEQLYKQMLEPINRAMNRHCHEAYTNGMKNGTDFPWRD